MLAWDFVLRALCVWVWPPALLCVCSVPGRPVGSSSGTDVLQGRSGQEHVSCSDAASANQQQQLGGRGAELTHFFLFGLSATGRAVSSCATPATRYRTFLATLPSTGGSAPTLSCHLYSIHWAHLKLPVNEPCAKINDWCSEYLQCIIIIRTAQYYSISFVHWTWNTVLKYQCTVQYPHRLYNYL